LFCTEICSLKVQVGSFLRGAASCDNVDNLDYAAPRAFVSTDGVMAKYTSTGVVGRDRNSARRVGCVI
jgi:hypothetical protein